MVFTKAVPIFAALMVLAISLMQFASTVRFIDFFYLIDKFNATDTRLPQVLDTYARASEAIYMQSYCRSDILNAGLGIVLADLDHKNPDIDFDSWLGAIKRAETLTQHALDCAPTVSEYWTRYAMIRQAAGEQPAELAKLLAHAVVLDPASISALRARFALWRKVSQETLEEARPTLMADLKTLLAYAGPPAVREVLKGSGDTLHPFIEEAFSVLPADRQARLARWKATPDQL